MLSELEPGEISPYISVDAPVPTPSLCLNINDASRDKIIIRPRCREYAKKQRASVACFTAMSLYNDSPLTETPAAPPPTTPPSTEKKAALLTPTERSAKLAKFFKLGSRSAAVYSGRIEKTAAKSQMADVVTQSRINHPPAPVVVGKQYSGCKNFKKITETTPVKVLTHPPPLLLPSAQHPCTCRDPKCCPRCRLLALADRFVTTVAEREHQLREMTL